MEQNKKNIPLSIWLLVLFVGLVLLILSIHYTLQKKAEADEIYNLETMEEFMVDTGNSYTNVLYSEGDEDVNFCYIDNPNKLINTEISYPAISSLNQNITDFLSSHDLSRCVLTITEVKSSGPTASFKALIHNTEKSLEAKYSVLTNQFDFILCD